MLTAAQALATRIAFTDEVDPADVAVLADWIEEHAKHNAQVRLDTPHAAKEFVSWWLLALQQVPQATALAISRDLIGKPPRAIRIEMARMLCRLPKTARLAATFIKMCDARGRGVENAVLAMNLPPRAERLLRAARAPVVGKGGGKVDWP